MIPTPRITTQSEPVKNSIDTTNTFEAPLHAHAFHLSPAKRNPLVNTKVK